jgi:hypothetical protein
VAAAAEQRDENRAVSLHYLMGNGEQGRRHGEVQHFGCRQTDDQIKFGRLLD